METWHVTCCSHQDSQDSSFYRTCFGRNSAWTSGPACSSSKWCPNKSHWSQSYPLTSLLRPVVTCHSIPPPRLTAARPGFIKSIATPHPRVPAPSPLYWPNLHHTWPHPLLHTGHNTVSHQNTAELEHLPNQYCHSIGCPLSCSVQPPFVLWILQRGLPPSWTINCFCNIDTIFVHFF